MRLKSIPRASFPAGLTCIDMLSRLESGEHSDEMRHAVTVVTQYMLDANSVFSESELTNCFALIESLYAK